MKSSRIDVNAPGMDVLTSGPDRPPFECIALLLQGGGALGAYQGGVYQALSEASLHPDWVAGISIGAINAALIAGNAPESRVERLRQFWEQITNPSAAGSPWANPFGWTFDPAFLAARGNAARQMSNQTSALLAALLGVPGFFGPRWHVPCLQPAGTPEATSYYDTAPLRSTLERLVDFDRINAGAMRFSVGAVNVATGNLVYFDNRTHRICPEHIMASGALPPGFPAIEIEGEHYWDGGVVSNTPLSRVLSGEPCDTLTFQIDLWSAKGHVPHDMMEVSSRQKDIQYSSRTRAITDHATRMQKMRQAIQRLLEELPEAAKDDPEIRAITEMARHRSYNIIHLIYQSKIHEGHSRDYEFGLCAMRAHWESGLEDIRRTLANPRRLDLPAPELGIVTHDIHRRD